MPKKKVKPEACQCPVGNFFDDMQKTLWGDGPFHKHMNQSKIEFLKAIRALIDDRIENLQKKASPKARRKATRIKVE